jgi:ATP-dependent Clp protease ATP-binding subunit ClpC
MMDAKFTQRIKDVLSYSKEEAARLGTPFIGPEHLFLGILRDGEGDAIEALVALGADLYELRKAIEQRIRPEEYVPVKDPENVPLIKAAERALKLVHLEAKAFKSEMVDTGHLLLAILKDENSLVSQLLIEKNIDYFSIKEELESYDIESRSDYPGGEEDDDERTGQFGGQGGKQQSGGNQPKGTSDTPVLDNFGVDLTKAAEESRLDPIIGREKEI